MELTIVQRVSCRDKRPMIGEDGSPTRCPSIRNRNGLVAAWEKSHQTTIFPCSRRYDYPCTVFPFTIVVVPPLSMFDQSSKEGWAPGPTGYAADGSFRWTTREVLKLGFAFETLNPTAELLAIG